MRIVDALVEVLKENESLTYKEAYLKIKERDLYQFGAKDPEAAVNAKLRCHCAGLDFPGASPVKYFKIVGQKGTRNLYALVKEDQEDLADKDEPKKKSKPVSEDDLLPEEKIDLTYLFYKNNIKRQILDHILDCHPKALKVLRERSHTAEAKAEMDRILTSMIATSEYYNQELEDYDKMKEIFDVVLESLTKPTVRLESACFVWMVKK